MFKLIIECLQKVSLFCILIISLFPIVSLYPDDFSSSREHSLFQLVKQIKEISLDSSTDLRNIGIKQLKHPAQTIYEYHSDKFSDPIILHYFSIVSRCSYEFLRLNVLSSKHHPPTLITSFN
jgi:hypothetical protein